MADATSTNEARHPGRRVVATAGHIDHGKSSLVLALTGTDPDRLAEEKARGLTIDLGFAFMQSASGYELAFVDVPGHVRFLKNMLAGVGAVDAAMLIVAATEGWMPQTEEHLRILDLLGVAHGLVVITKADLVDAETLEIAELEILEHLEGSALEGAPIVSCDSRSGRGLDDVRRTLDEVLGATPPPLDGERPRLWIDRVFASRGAGTVVTGTLVGGSLNVDDEILLLPLRRKARVRGLESHHARVIEATAGSRVAVNLVGVEHSELARGHAIVRAAQWAEPRAIDVELTGFDEPFRGRARLKAYIGSGEHDVVVRAIDDRYARIFIATPLPIAPSDRLVLRDPGRQQTIGGAVVLDVAPAPRARQAPGRLAQPIAERVVSGRAWIAPEELVVLAGVATGEARSMADELVTSGAAVRVHDELVPVFERDRLADAARLAIAEHHTRLPLEPGIELTALVAQLARASNATPSAGRLSAPRIEALLSGLDDVVVHHGRARRRSHQVIDADDPAARRLIDALEAQPFSPPTPSELAVAPEIVRALVRNGDLIEVDGIIFSRGAIERGQQIVVEAMQLRGAITVADARDLLGSSRKFVLALLAHFDRTGVTRRRGDDRIPGPKAS